MGGWIATQTANSLKEIAKTHIFRAFAFCFVLVYQKHGLFPSKDIIDEVRAVFI